MAIEIYQSNAGYLWVEDREIPMYNTVWIHSTSMGHDYITITNNSEVVIRNAPLRHIKDNLGAGYANVAAFTAWWNALDLISITVSPSNYIYVGKNGNDTIGTGSAENPYLTIGKAITVASSGTTIFVWPGSYTENLTLKANVNITAPVLRGVTITGNHTANFSGTVITENCILVSATGVTLTISGSNTTNLQMYNSSCNSGTGDAIAWANTNASSKLLLTDSTVNVTTSGATARCFYSTTGATGGVIASGVSFELNNTDNVCLSIGGAISFVHTSDVVDGTILVSGTASYIGSMIRITSATQATLTTNSATMSVLMDCVQMGTAIPMIAGAGLFSEAAIVYGSTGKGTASTLNGGAGAFILNMCSMKLRAGTLKPVPQDGLLEYDGTHLYFTIGAVRSQVV
jgi:hypothetical protein